MKAQTRVQKFCKVGNPYVTQNGRLIAVAKILAELDACSLLAFHIVSLAGYYRICDLY